MSWWKINPLTWWLWMDFWPLKKESRQKGRNSLAEDIKPAYTHGYFMDRTGEAASLLNIKQEDLPAGIAFTPPWIISRSMWSNCMQRRICSQKPGFRWNLWIRIGNHTARTESRYGREKLSRRTAVCIESSRCQTPARSAIKPLVVYAPAVEVYDFTPCFIEDAPVTFSEYNDIRPAMQAENFVELLRRTALAKSINIPAVKILNEIALKPACRWRKRWDPLLRMIGTIWPLHWEEWKRADSLEMARAYKLGRPGSYKNDTTIRRIEDSTGKQFIRHSF